MQGASAGTAPQQGVELWAVRAASVLGEDVRVPPGGVRGVEGAVGSAAGTQGWQAGPLPAGWQCSSAGLCGRSHTQMVTAGDGAGQG